MNSKMTTNSQLSTNESKKQKQTKQTRTGTESEMEITWKVISGEGEENGVKVQGMRSIIGRHKIDRGRFRIV